MLQESQTKTDVGNNAWKLTVDLGNSSLPKIIASISTS